MKTFREYCQNFMPRVHKILLENNVFRIIYQFLSFRTLSENFLDVWHTFFAWFVKTAFYGFRGHFWRKNFEWKLNNLLVHKRRFLLRLLFGICASHPRIPGDGKCGCFARVFLVGLLKLNFSCPEDTIEKNVYQNIYHILLLFWTVSKTFSDAWAKFFWLKKNSLQYVTLSYRLSGYGSRGNFWRKNIFAERKFFSISFRLSAHDAWVSGKKPEGSSKVNSTCPEEFFGKKLFLRKNNHHFR